MKKELKNFLYLVIGRIGSSSIRSGFLIILAFLLEPNDYGQFAFLISLAGATGVIAKLGLPTTVTIYLSKGKKELANNINLIAIISTSLGAAILAFINVYAAFLCISMALFSLQEHNQIGNQKYKEHVKAILSKSVLVLVLGISLFYIAEIPGIILGMAFANLILAFPLFRKISTYSFSIEPIRENYKFILNNYGVASSGGLARHIDKLVIGMWFGFLSLGAYYFNMQILIAIQILSQVLHRFLISSNKKQKKLSFVIIIITIISTVSVIVISPFVVESVFPKYLEGVFALQILVVAAIPNVFSSILTARMQSIESTRVGYSVIIRIVPMVILLYVLGTMYDMVGLSVAIVVSSILNTLFLYYLYKKSSSTNDL